MPGVAQRRTKLGGKVYDRGDEVPDEFITPRIVGMGLVSVAAGGAGSSAGQADAAVVAELEQVKAELAAALALLEEEGLDAPPAPSFDPDIHTVAEVVAYIDANADDLARVRAAEAAGEARKTLLADLDRRLADAADDKGGNAEGE